MVDERELEIVAEIAKLSLSKSDDASMLNDLNRILQYVDKIIEADAESVQLSGRTLDEKSLRPDENENDLNDDLVSKNVNTLVSKGIRFTSDYGVEQCVMNL